MSSDKEVLEILERTGAFLKNDHFVGVSGRHLDAYFTKDALLVHPTEASRIGELFAERVKDLPVEIVAAPALGGIIFGQWTAYHLSRLKGREVLAVFTEKTPDGGQAFARGGYAGLLRGKRALVVEDTVTTGGSVQKTAEAVRAAGGEVLSVGVITNRDPKEINSERFGAPFFSLLEYPVPSYSPEECPMCKKGVPINTAYGHGKKFLGSARA